MQIKFTAKDMCGSALPTYKEKRFEKVMDIEDYVSNALLSNSSGNDIDIMEQEQKFTREAFGRLINLLAEKGVLAIDDVRAVTLYDVATEEREHVLLKNK